MNLINIIGWCIVGVLGMALINLIIEIGFLIKRNIKLNRKKIELEESIKHKSNEINNGLIELKKKMNKLVRQIKDKKMKRKIHKIHRLVEKYKSIPGVTWN